MSTDRSQPTVHVLMGGPDAERPVSIMSGSEVARALREDGTYHVVEHTIDTPTAADLKSFASDVVFPVLHGRWGEGGELQSRLEEAGVEYVGSRPLSAATAMDKLRTKMLVRQLGIATPSAREVRPDEPIDLEPPLVLKPVDDGSSVDLAICHSVEEVESARRRLSERRPRLMAERFVTGREITAGIVLDEILPVIEIVPADGLYDYDAKYEREDTRYLLDPELPEGVADYVRRASRETYRHLGCRDVARVDFMLNDEGPWFLEINTMPGFTTHSLVPMAAAHAGCPMPELCRRLVDAAAARRPGHNSSQARPGARADNTGTLEVLPPRERIPHAGH